MDKQFQANQTRDIRERLARMTAQELAQRYYRISEMLTFPHQNDPPGRPHRPSLKDFGADAAALRAAPVPLRQAPGRLPGAASPPGRDVVPREQNGRR